jgi:hypothetical protein
MSKWVSRKAAQSAVSVTALAVLVAVVGAGSKWY